MSFIGVDIFSLQELRIARCLSRTDWYWRVPRIRCCLRPCLLPFIQHLTIIIRQDTEGPFSCIHQIGVFRGEEMSMKGLGCRLKGLEVVVAGKSISPLIQHPWAAQTAAQDQTRGLLQPVWRTSSLDDKEGSNSQLEELLEYCTGNCFDQPSSSS